jgi:four helix bundle protein
MRTFRDILVWEKSHQFALQVYRFTQSFPKSELYGITQQIRRSSASVPTNIAEGCGRHGDRDFVRFLDIALGSANEADYQLLLSQDLGYLKEKDYRDSHGKITEIQKMLVSFIKKIRAADSGSP